MGKLNAFNLRSLLKRRGRWQIGGGDASCCKEVGVQKQAESCALLQEGGKKVRVCELLQRGIAEQGERSDVYCCKEGGAR